MGLQPRARFPAQQWWILFCSPIVRIYTNFPLHGISTRIIVMHIFIQCINYHRLCCLHWRKENMHKLIFSCFSFCFCLCSACDNPMSLADMPCDSLSYGKISNHSKQIKSAERTWKINVLGGGSCMTIMDFERWQMLPFSPPPPCPSQLEEWAAIGQLSCRDAYRLVTVQAEKLQQEHVSPFSLLSLTRITRGDWRAKSTAHISTSPFALHLPLIFPCALRKVSAQCKTFLNSFGAFKAAMLFHSILIFNWLHFLLYDPALVTPAFA